GAAWHSARRSGARATDQCTTCESGHRSGLIQTDRFVENIAGLTLVEDVSRRDGETSRRRVADLLASAQRETWRDGSVDASTVRAGGSLVSKLVRDRWSARSHGMSFFRQPVRDPSAVDRASPFRLAEENRAPASSREDDRINFVLPAGPPVWPNGDDVFSQRSLDRKTS